MRHVDAARLLELGPVLLVIGLDLLIRDRLEKHLGIEDDVLQAPPLRPRELGLVGLDIGLELAVRHRHVRHQRRDLDRRPRRAHPLVAQSVALP